MVELASKFDCLMYFVNIFHEIQEFFFGSCPYYEYIIDISFVEMDKVRWCLLVFVGVRWCSLVLVGVLILAQFLILMSISAIKMLAMVGAAFVPMAVPTFWMYSSELNSKILSFNTWLSISINVLVVTILSCLVSSALLMAEILSSVGMFEYRPTTSIETGKELGGIGVLLSTSMCLRRSGVSCRTDQRRGKKF
jgi:hypothetical protein